MREGSERSEVGITEPEPVISTDRLILDRDISVLDTQVEKIDAEIQQVWADWQKRLDIGEFTHERQAVVRSEVEKLKEEKIKLLVQLDRLKFQRAKLDRN